MPGNNDSTLNGNDKLDKGKLNTLNTVALLSILIATVTFTAGTNQPDGFYQEGQQIGKALGNKHKAFKIFSVANDMAFFASLLVVLLISNICPANNKALDVLLGVNTAIMWVAVICMAAAYLAARWVSLPHRQWTRWCTVLLGSFIIIIAVILVLTVKLKPTLLESTKSPLPEENTKATPDAPLLPKENAEAPPEALLHREEHTKASDPEAPFLDEITSSVPVLVPLSESTGISKGESGGGSGGRLSSNASPLLPNEAEYEASGLSSPTMGRITALPPRRGQLTQLPPKRGQIKAHILSQLEGAKFRTRF